MDLTSLVIFLLIGAVAGWLAGQIMKGGFGLVGDIIVGVIGSVIGGCLEYLSMMTGLRMIVLLALALYLAAMLVAMRNGSRSAQVPSPLTPDLREIG